MGGLRGGGGERMDLVDEQDLVMRERVQQGDHVAGAGNERPRRGVHGHFEFAGQNRGERGLSKARRSVEQHVIEGLSPGARGADADFELFEDRGLADVLAEVPRPESLVELFVPAAGRSLLRAHSVLASAPAVQCSRPEPGAGSEVNSPTSPSGAGRLRMRMRSSALPRARTPSRS